MLVLNAADNPSGRRNRHAERAGARGHLSVERNQRRPDALSDCDMQGIEGAER